jgi:hypothetical protein
MDDTQPGTDDAAPYRDLHLERPHSARMYDFFLGGKDNYRSDRDAAVKVVQVYPSVFVTARENRAFMHRATRMLAEHGIRQWLDIGTGIPTSPNLHEVAQRVAPEARVVYVDNDPIVLAHAQALLTSTPEGRTAYIEADATDPEAILGSQELRDTLDLTRPVALSLNALLHFITDEMGAYGIVKRLMDALPSGSALALTHGTGDFDMAVMSRVVEVYEAGGTAVQLRTREEIERFFAGLELAEPGIEVAHRWRPNETDVRLRSIAGQETVSDAEVGLWAGVGFKP